MAALKSEGVQLPSPEFGWLLKDKFGFDPLRKQLLETALQGAEEYPVIEAEVLRLFKDLHTADPKTRPSKDHHPAHAWRWRAKFFSLCVCWNYLQQGSIQLFREVFWKEQYVINYEKGVAD